jgi:hypothetical protein
MTRSVLISSVLFSLTIEAVLWGVRSGPGWLILVVLGALLSHSLRIRLERPLSSLGQLALAGGRRYGRLTGPLRCSTAALGGPAVVRHHTGAGHAPHGVLCAIPRPPALHLSGHPGIKSRGLRNGFRGLSPPCRPPPGEVCACRCRCWPSSDCCLCRPTRLTATFSARASTTGSPG